MLRNKIQIKTELKSVSLQFGKAVFWELQILPTELNMALEMAFHSFQERVSQDLPTLPTCGLLVSQTIAPTALDTLSMKNSSPKRAG